MQKKNFTLEMFSKFEVEAGSVILIFPSGSDKLGMNPWLVPSRWENFNTPFVMGVSIQTIAFEILLISFRRSGDSYTNL